MRVPAVDEITIVWKTEAAKRNMDVDAKCTRKSRKKCRKNLGNTTS